MPASKVIDHDEVRRWFEEGKTYPWMVEEYKRKYNVDTGVSMWSNYARRKKLKRRMTWNPDLIPWSVAQEHKTRAAYSMLTQEARVRAGEPISDPWRKKLESWKARLAAQDLVVHYDPEIEPYFHLVPRREGIDGDLVRVPDHIERNLPISER